MSKRSEIDKNLCSNFENKSERKSRVKILWDVIVSLMNYDLSRFTV